MSLSRLANWVYVVGPIPVESRISESLPTRSLKNSIICDESMRCYLMCSSCSYDGAYETVYLGLTDTFCAGFTGGFPRDRATSFIMGTVVVIGRGRALLGSVPRGSYRHTFGILNGFPSR